MVGYGAGPYAEGSSSEGDGVSVVCRVIGFLIWLFLGALLLVVGFWGADAPVRLVAGLTLAIAGLALMFLFFYWLGSFIPFVRERMREGDREGAER